MIKIVISGPQSAGKSRIAVMFLRALRHAGFVNVEVWTTNEDVVVPVGATREQE